MSESAHVTFDDYDFVKLMFPRLIPKTLLENIKGCSFTPEAFYDYQESQVNKGNPNNLLYALVNKEKKIHGFLWCDVNAIDNSLCVNTLSVDKHLWHKGKIMPKICSFLSEIKKARGCPKVYWMTTNDKFFSKHGFKRSKNVLMEYNEDKESIGNYGTK